MTEKTATAVSALDLLVDVFRDVLDYADLTVDTDFYEAGGDSLTAFQITGRLARKDPDGAATFTEMLPTPEQTWLTDDERRRYTAEFRSTRSLRRSAR
jgi:hypothetical protein